MAKCLFHILLCSLDLDYECSNFGIVDHLQSPDIRFGFWNHAVINVTWARPSGEYSLVVVVVVVVVVAL